MREWLADAPGRRRAHRAELRHRRGAVDEVRPARGAVLRLGRGDRAAPPGKVDAPSGTAVRTAELIAAARVEAGLGADARRDHAGSRRARAARTSTASACTRCGSPAWSRTRRSYDIPIDKTSDLYRNLNKALRDFGDPHQPIQVALRTFLLLVIEARVRILPDYLFEKVEPKIRAALLDRFSFERRELGQDALLSEAMGTIQSVQGVAYVDVDKFDWVDEKKVVDHLAGVASLSAVIGRRERIPVSLALVNTDEIDPSRRIKPAEIAYMSPDIKDTTILSEITS